MPTGGPLSFGVGLLGGFTQGRQREMSRIRERLNEALRLQKEDRENKEAIARETLNMEKAKQAAQLAKSQFDLVQARIAQIKADPGKPYNDAVLDRNLYEAHEKVNDTSQQVALHQKNLMQMVYARNHAVEAKVPATTSGTLGFGAHDFGKEYADTFEHERDTAEGQKFEKDTADEADELDPGYSKSAIAQKNQAERTVGGLEAEQKAGQSRQGQINEEERNKQIYPLDKESRELQTKQQDSQAGMAAAAQEIQARQAQQQQLQATPGYQQALSGGAGTGKQGGGLIGAITGKAGGMGAPGASAPAQGVGGQAGQAVGVPTVAQAIGPTLGKIAQMPVSQATQLIGPAVKQLFGGQGPSGSSPQAGQGAPMPPPRPQFGTPQSFAGPRQPIQVPPPSVAMQGQGGGLTSKVQQTAATPTLSQLKNYVYRQAPKYGIDPRVAWDRVWAKEGGNTGVYNGPGGAPGSGFYATNQNDHGHSLGAFQLYDKGEGALFKQRTGQPITPSNAFAQADFSLQEAAKKGWKPWHAAANTGVGPWEGINRSGTQPAAQTQTGTYGGQPSTSGQSAPATPAIPSGGGVGNVSQPGTGQTQTGTKQALAQPQSYQAPPVPEPPPQPAFMEAPQQAQMQQQQPQQAQQRSQQLLTPNSEHIAALRKNPHLQKEFDQKFGQGAAQLYIGGM